MSYQIFYRLLVDARDCTDFDEYVAECGGSVPLDDVDDVLSVLRYIWDYSQAPEVRTIWRASGLSQNAFKAEYNIPSRSFESWASDSASSRRPPEYTVRLLAFAVLSDILKGRK